jgi:MFS transporter, DHA1 family, multidrug resistance protein
MNNSTYRPAQLMIISMIAYAMVAFSGVCMDIYVPGLVSMSHDLQVSRHLVVLTISFFSIGMALGQLFAGAVVDSVGRKKSILVSVCMQLLILSLIVFTKSILLIITLRFVQGLMVSLLSVSGRAVLLDLFSGDVLLKKLNSMTIFWGLGPLLAPFVGGYLVAHAGWHACFYFMTGYLLLVLLLVLFVYTETLSQSTAIVVGDIFASYRKLFTSRHFVMCSITAGMMSGFIYFYNVIMPFLIKAHSTYSYATTSIITGYCSTLMGGAWIIGGFFSRIMQLNLTARVKLSTIGALVCSVTMLIFSFYLQFNYLVLLIPSFLLLIFIAICFSNFITLGLNPVRHMAGKANAAMFSIIWVACSIYSGVGALVTSDTLNGIAIGYVFIVLLLTVFMLTYLKTYATQTDA